MTNLPPPPAPTPRETAYHEAGHAIVGVAYGAKLKYIINKPRDHCANLSGFTELLPKVATALAGALAGHLGTGATVKPDWFSSPPYVWQGSMDDFVKVREAYTAATNNPDQDELAEIVRQGKELAWEVLIANLEPLRKLADELQVKSRIEGDEALRLIGTLVAPPPLDA